MLEENGHFIPLKTTFPRSSRFNIRARTKHEIRTLLGRDNCTTTAQSIARLSRLILTVEAVTMEIKITPSECCKGTDGKHTESPDPIDSGYQVCLCGLFMHQSTRDKMPYIGCICFGCIRNVAERIQKLARKLPQADSDQVGSEDGLAGTSHQSSSRWSIYTNIGQTKDGLSLETFVSQMQRWKPINYHKVIHDRVSAAEGSLMTDTGGSVESNSSRGTTKSRNYWKEREPKEPGSLTIPDY